ncbi:MAG: hypothetical protein V4739_13080 [Pseudomonadota bacterium]
MTSSALLNAHGPGTCEGDPAWLRAVAVLNLSPVAYADTSWLPLNVPHASAALRRELSNDLLAQHALNEQFNWQPTQPAMRPMLLSRTSWDELALAAGVLAHRNRLRQVVQRDALAQWRELLADRLELLWSPLAERVPALPSPGRSTPGLQALNTLREDGQALLLGLLNPSDPEHLPVLGRAQFRLPRDRWHDKAAWRPLVSQADSVAESLMELLPRWSPQWTWLS